MQRFEPFYFEDGRKALDRVNVVGDDVPPGTLTFIDGTPTLPIMIFYQTTFAAPRVAIDAAGRCWATCDILQTELTPMRWLRPVELATLFRMATAAKLPDLVLMLELHLGETNPYRVCPTCGCLVPRERIG